jgi:uncharacterized protein YjbI with pentapeptide repeats
MNTTNSFIESINQFRLNTEMKHLQIKHKRLLNENIVKESLFSALFVNVTFININLTNTRLSNSVFNSCFFKNCHFKDTDFHSNTFNHCSFENCHFENTDLDESSFKNVSLRNCSIKVGEEGNVNNSLFESCDFVEIIFDECDPLSIWCTKIVDCKFSKLNQTIEFHGDFDLVDLLTPKNGVITIFRNS